MFAKVVFWQKVVLDKMAVHFGSRYVKLLNVDIN